MELKAINEVYNKQSRPEKILQFGEGNFLRAFCDWMIDLVNEKTDFNGSVVVVQPIENGMCDVLTSQNGMYTHIMRGMQNGVPAVETKVIDVIPRCIKPYDAYDAYLQLAENPAFRFVVSKTTEAGIVFDAGDGPVLMYNPVITKKAGEYQTEEGCLSLSGVRPTKRWKRIKVEYLNDDFRPRCKTFTEWAAQIIQHEIDHCDGILI